jgi:hypothetical protein
MSCKMTPQAALDFTKDWILSAPSASGFIDDNALRLSGEPEETIDREIKKFGDEMFAAMDSELFSHARRFAMTLATCALIRDRIAEMQQRGSGRA